MIIYLFEIIIKSLYLYITTPEKKYAEKRTKDEYSFEPNIQALQQGILNNLTSLVIFNKANKKKE